MKRKSGLRSSHANDGKCTNEEEGAAPDSQTALANRNNQGLLTRIPPGKKTKTQNDVGHSPLDKCVETRMCRQYSHAHSMLALTLLGDDTSSSTSSMSLISSNASGPCRSAAANQRGLATDAPAHSIAFLLERLGILTCTRVFKGEREGGGGGERDSDGASVCMGVRRQLRPQRLGHSCNQAAPEKQVEIQTAFCSSRHTKCS